MSSTDPSRVTSLAGARARRDWYSLEERHAAMAAGRVLALGIIAIATLTPWLDLSARERAVAVAGCLVALAAQAVLRWLPSRWPRTLRTAVDAALVVDALLVLLLAYESGGSPARPCGSFPSSAWPPRSPCRCGRASRRSC